MLGGEVQVQRRAGTECAVVAEDCAARDIVCQLGVTLSQGTSRQHREQCGGLTGAKQLQEGRGRIPPRNSPPLKAKK